MTAHQRRDGESTEDIPMKRGASSCDYSALDDIEAGDARGGGQASAFDADDGLDSACLPYTSGGSFWNKGNVSNLMTFSIMMVGILLRATTSEEEWRSGSSLGSRLLLSFGLFGFAGGITNWLAVKMLFDKIPGLIGSGIVPARFKEIRTTTKQLLMDTFFEKGFLQRYFSSKGGSFTARMDINAKIKTMLESDDVDKLLDQKLLEIGTRPEGMVIAMMGLGPDSLKPIVKPFLLSMGDGIGPLLEKHLDTGSLVDAAAIHAEVDRLMSERMLQLTPGRVKKLVEAVIRRHLGWLIVWGNVFGGAIGLFAEAVGY